MNPARPGSSGAPPHQNSQQLRSRRQRGRLRSRCRYPPQWPLQLNKCRCRLDDHAAARTPGPPRAAAPLPSLAALLPSCRALATTQMLTHRAAQSHAPKPHSEGSAPRWSAGCLTRAALQGCTPVPQSKAAPPRPLDTPGRRPFSRFAPWAPYARTTAKDGPTPRPPGPRRSPHQLISKPPQSPRSASAPRSASPRSDHPPCDSTSRLCRDGRFRAFTRDAYSRTATPCSAASRSLD